MNTSLTIPKNTREAYQQAVKAITPKEMAKKLDVSLTHVYRSCASKKTNGEARTNPIKQAKIIVKELIKNAKFDAAYVIAASIAHEIGGEISFRNHTPDKNTYQEEMLDTVSSVSTLMDFCQQYIDGKKTYIQMWWAKKNAHKEIDELVAMAKQVKQEQKEAA